MSRYQSTLLRKKIACAVMSPVDANRYPPLNRSAPVRYATPAITVRDTGLPRSRLGSEGSLWRPDFTLSDQDGKDVSLRDLVTKSKAVALIFYRGFW